MEGMTNSQIKNLILKNQQKRTEELKSLEIYFNKLLEILENEWKTEKKTHNWNYADYCKKYIDVVGVLNKELRSLQAEEKWRRTVDNLLSFEESNYKFTIGIFAKKIRHYDLLKKDADDEDFDKNEKDIEEARNKKDDVRERINELVQELIYS